ncbi:sensor histidine kinase [Streptomyces sp.]|uniref:sensor histidine kinase n=1 Tax=Streptomyces sp. TaxID=1931 RepID=UPI002CDD83BE|nr:sensor domain-containing protein [Streptomyces sp.]HLL36817.1 sensor domain-containing protein [Streptomyces sp.]HZF87920.1 sensor domain-containing protein [Streptomyces sp.]
MARPGFLLSAWPWRAAGYLLTGAVSGAVVLVALVSLAVAGGVLTVVLVGLPLLVGLALAGIPVAWAERWRLRLVDAEPVPRCHREPAAAGLWAWLTTRLRERATWQELGHALLYAGLLWPLDALLVTAGLLVPLAVTATPLLMATAGDGREAKVVKLWTVTGWPSACAVAVLGLLLLAVGGYALGGAAGARAGLARLLLTSREGELDARVVELTRSRVRLVDAFEAERRRIERDLHDGAQQRLVALTMTLGLARLDAPPGPLADQLARAHEEAGRVLGELRELIHGIHPQVLADYGLGAAVADAADRSAVPVDVDLELPGRVPQAVEAAGYFVVCEALANVARHSGAGRAEVRGGHAGGRLWLEVWDDGRGGAEAARDGAGGGSGLTGLADRVSVLDGRLGLSSPPGGPTLLRVEIPCELSETAVPCA